MQNESLKYKEKAKLAAIQRSVGKDVANARKRAGITQVTLSSRTGMQQASLSKLECGKANPTIETLQCIAATLNMDVDISFNKRSTNCSS